jgi:hypothetical protein
VNILPQKGFCSFLGAQKEDVPCANPLASFNPLASIL